MPLVAVSRALPGFAIHLRAKAFLKPLSLLSVWEVRSRGGGGWLTARSSSVAYGLIHAEKPISADAYRQKKAYHRAHSCH